MRPRAKMAFVPRHPAALIALFALMLPGPAHAETASDRLLNSLSPQGYVSDFAGVLDSARRARIEQFLAQVESRDGVEIAVVVLPSLEGGEIDDFSNRLFSHWGIGKRGKDNGVLLLAAIEDRKVRIEVGYGLEPTLTDARAGWILDREVLPAFRDGRYADGLDAGARRIVEVVVRPAGEAVASLPEASPLPDPVRSLLALLVWVVVILILIRHPWLLLYILTHGRSSSGGGFRGGGFGGGFGGFGGGMSGGGGASRGW